MILAETYKILLVFPFTNECFQLLHIVAVIEKSVALIVPQVDDPAPRGPAVDAEGGGEEIVVGHVGCHLVVVQSADDAHTQVVLIAVEQFLAEWEERQ